MRLAGDGGEDGPFHGLLVRDRPQARRLRRPAARLRGLTPVPDQKRAWGAINGHLRLPLAPLEVRRHNRDVFSFRVSWMGFSPNPWQNILYAANRHRRRDSTRAAAGSHTRVA